MQKFGVIDIWREKFPGISSFTWNNKACTIMSCIDYWLTPCNVHKEYISVNNLPMPLTDHKAVSINISLHSSLSSNYHNSYRKLNKSLLEHEFEMTMCSLIAQYWNLAQISNNYCTNWELFKFEACKFLRKFGSLLSKAKKLEEETIISKITAFTHKSPPNLSDNEYLELFTLQSQLDNIYKRRAAFIRSRQRWLEKGEQNSV